MPEAKMACSRIISVVYKLMFFVRSVTLFNIKTIIMKTFSILFDKGSGTSGGHGTGNDGSGGQSGGGGGSTGGGSGTRGS